MRGRGWREDVLAALPIVVELEREESMFSGSMSSYVVDVGHFKGSCAINPDIQFLLVGHMR